MVPTVSDVVTALYDDSDKNDDDDNNGDDVDDEDGSNLASPVIVFLT